MGEEKWIRRKPGSASGTVVPPPAGDGLPTLPQRRNPSRHRPRPEGHGYGRPRTAPELPDNVRLLFQPVLHSRDARSARDRIKHPASGPPWQAADAPATRNVAREPQAAEDWPIAAMMREPARGAASPAPRAATATATPAGLASPAGASGAGRRGAAGSGHRRHVIWLVTLTVLVLATAAGTAVALVRHPTAAGTNGKVPAALSGAAGARAKAARWISREVSRGAMIGCDTVMCGDLSRAGVPSADLLVIKPTAADPLGPDLVVATPSVQSQFGSRLSTEYAPTVLASFGSRQDRVAVRVIAPDGAAAYQLALSRDLAARELMGTQLIGNKQIALPPSAQTELAAGEVDPRLLITLPALAQRHAVRVLGFYDRAPGASSGVPMSGVLLSGDDPRSGLSAPAYLRWLLSFLHSQQSLYRASAIATTSRHGQTVVSVRFARPTPIGLLH